MTCCAGRAGSTGAGCGEDTRDSPQIVEQNFKIPQIQIVQGTQTSESLGTALVRQVAQAEIVEVVEIGAPLLAESGPHHVR